MQDLEQKLKKVIIHNNNKEKFTKSKCNCNVCDDMNKASKNYHKWVPKDESEKIFKNMIDKLEQKYNINNK